MASYPLLITEDIVISGISGRFPESNSTDEFAQRLYNKEDLITSDDRRWPIGLSIIFKLRKSHTVYLIRAVTVE